MTRSNGEMRAALREIESRAATALANQPTNSDECGRHLNKALGAIEYRAHTALMPQGKLPRLEYAGRGQIESRADDETRRGVLAGCI